MSLFSQVGSAFKKFLFWGSSIAQASWSWVSFFFNNGRTDYRQAASRIYDNGAVLPAISFFWRQLQYPRLIVTSRVKGQSGRAKWNEIDDHAFPIAVANGPFVDQSILWYGTILSWIVEGNAYWYKVRNGLGEVIGYIYIPHMQIWPMADWNNEDGSKLVTYYRYEPVGGKPVGILPEDIVHFRHGVDPENPMKGLSPLMAALVDIVGDNEAAILGAALMKNGGITAIAFSPKEGQGTIDPTKWDESKKRWRENTTGEMAGSPNYVPFPVDVINLGYKPSEMVLDKNRALFVSRILAAIGFDPMVLGLPSEQKTYSNYGEAIDAATKNTILPILRILAGQLTYETLVPDFNAKPNERVDWDLSEVPALAEEESELWGRVTTAWDSGLIKRSEGRRALNYDVNEAEDDVYKTDLEMGGKDEAKQKANNAKVQASLRQKNRKSKRLHEQIVSEMLADDAA